MARYMNNNDMKDADTVAPKIEFDRWTVNLFVHPWFDLMI